MEIEILYFERCPWYRDVLRLLKDVLREKGIQEEIRMLEIKDEKDAERLGFIGSPTVRINGVDIDRSARRVADFGKRCRIYMVDGRPGGIPSREMLIDAIKEAR